MKAVERRSPATRRAPAAGGSHGVRDWSEILARLGARVRAARTARGESRARLATRSGLSLRFLAQLEAGDSNISLLRLMDVAAALDLDVADLLRDASGVPPSSSASNRRDRHRLVALLGLRGAGKSSVGRRLASRLHLRFYELDALVERQAGLPIGQIFELHGEAYFRRLERETLQNFVAQVQAGVLATGGGIVTDPETMAVLLRHCTTIWLRAKPEEHWQRVVHQGDRRPMRDNPDAMMELRALFDRREALYARALYTVDTSKQTVAQVTSAILHTLPAPSRPARSTG